MSFMTPISRIKQQTSNPFATPTAAENEAGFSAGARRGSAPNNLGWEYSSNIYNNKDPDFDPDLYRAAILQRYIRGEGGLNNQVRTYAGDVNPTLARSAMNEALGRAGQRRELRGQLNEMPGMQAQEESLLRQEANRAVGQGVRSTRQNYNRRGLLYGGMREGGEQQVRAQGASTLASNIAGSRRDYQNQMNAKKQAIASLGLQSQRDALNRASAVEEQSMRNQVARLQAYQQLGAGVGYALGTFGYSGGGGAQQAPAAEPSSAFMGTGASDGFGGSQMAAGYDYTDRMGRTG